jgi:glyoxylase-like metal-dependent hydrolase (beta-lactamase superfamily II)
MQLGAFQLSTISGGRFRTDGGGMFGVVPKPLWSKTVEVDERNTIPQDTTCLLVEGEGRRVLIDTGYGPKIGEKQRRIISSEPGDPLARSLEARGLTRDDIDTVILSHLHFDHAGGGVSQTDDGQLVPAFRNAEYVVQRREWEIATARHPELLPAYPLENILPLEDSGRLRFIDGDVEILPGIRSVVTGGHTEAHMMVVIESQGKKAAFLADICPTWRHLPMLWCMAYDVNVLQTRRIKPRILGTIADEGWLAISDHDPDHAAAYLRRHENREFAVAEAFVEL